MKVTHYICPQNCGKTAFAKNLQMEDPENTLLFSSPSKDIINRVFRGCHYDKVIFDDFLKTYSLVDNKMKFIEWFICNILSILNKGGELILISTPDKLRNSSSYLLFANGLLSKNRIKNEFVNKETIMKEIEEFDFLCLCPNDHIKVIKTRFESYTVNEVLEKHTKSLLSEEQFLTRIKGEFLK